MAGMATTYPAPPTSDQADDYHGTLIADPYRPLEDVDAPATRAWIGAQNALTDAILGAAPARAAIRARLAELWDVPRRGVPWRAGQRWFQLRNTGVQDQDTLWVADGPAAEGRLLIDPNRLNPGGTTTLNGIAASETGRLVAFATSDAGSDWQTWRVRRADDGADLPDRVPWGKFSGAAWTHDEAGFFYGRFATPDPDAALAAPNRDMELRYHRLGADNAADRVVYARPDQPDWGFFPEVSDDGTLLVITVTRGTDPETRVHVADLAGFDGAGALDVRPLLDAGDARYELAATVARTLYLVTNLGAPNGRLVAVDADDPAAAIREVLPESGDTLESVTLVGGRLAALSLHDARARLTLFELDGTPVTEVALPAAGTVAGLAGRRDDATLHLALDQFAAPRQLVEVAAATGAVRLLPTADLPWDPERFTTEQAVVTSADGTRFPLFLARRRDLVPTGDVPALLYGYGGFNIPIGPAFKPEWLAWMERGGLLAVASLRGGGEYGTAWHDAGRLANKQNVFDDFAAALRWLAASGWTRAGRIGISGRSNGGLLVGATLAQHPDLFGAAVAEVGVMDMLRFHRFTVGWGWTSDYGDPDDPEQFRWLRAYSPLHNLRPGTAYPATLVTTGDHDDRVVPGHSLKFAAALQAAQAGDAPILLRVDTDAGHGAGKPVGKLVAERADVLAFLELALGTAG